RVARRPSGPAAGAGDARRPGTSAGHDPAAPARGVANGGGGGSSEKSIAPCQALWDGERTLEAANVSTGRALTGRLACDKSSGSGVLLASRKSSPWRHALLEIDRSIDRRNTMRRLALSITAA